MHGFGLQVRVALEKKITRERIGVEISKCLDGPQPLQAVAYLMQMQIFSAVFQVLRSLVTALNHTLVLPIHHALVEMLPYC
jgi:tRNA nucleotidyltransferase/poly(A) polymerase